MRVAIAVLTAVTLVVTACSGPDQPVAPFGAQAARLGQELTVLGWRMTVSELRWGADQVLIDVTASIDDPDSHAAPEELRFGLYGAVAHPLEVNGIGSC